MDFVKQQWTMALGLQCEKSSRATLMVYTQVLFALAVDTFLDTTPGFLSLLGSGLIVGSAILVATQNAKSVDVRQRSGDETELTESSVV